MKPHRWLVMASLCALVVAGSLFAGVAASGDDWDSIVAKASESVVSVDSKDPDGRRRTASGIIWDQVGSVVTVAAIVGPDRQFEVITRSGDRFAAELVGLDGTSGIAVLTAHGLKGIRTKLADVGRVETGDGVAAVGHPFRGGASIGVVSDVTRVAGPRGGLWMIQTSAVVYPGDVGGLLINARGEMIGLLAGRLRGSFVRIPFPEARSGLSRVAFGHARPEPINFALPADVVDCVAREILEHGHVRRSWLGLAVVSPRVLRTSTYLVPTGGSLVVGLIEGSPAHMGGVAIGDVVVRLAGREVRSAADLERNLLAVAPRDKVPITVVRKGDRKGLEIRAAERDPERHAVWMCTHGIKVREKELVVAGGWPGVEDGDRLIAVDGKRVNDLAALQIALMCHPQGITVLRGSKRIAIPNRETE